MNEESINSISYAEMEDVKNSMLPVLNEFVDDVRQKREKAKRFVGYIVDTDVHNVVDDTYHLDSLFAETQNVDNISQDHLRDSLKAAIQKAYDIGRMHQQNLQEKLKLASQLQKEKTIKEQLLRFIDAFWPSFEDKLEKAATRETTRINLTRNLKEEAEHLNAAAKALNQELKKTKQELKEANKAVSTLEYQAQENVQINREKDNAIQRRENDVNRLQSELERLAKESNDQMQSMLQLEKEKSAVVRTLDELKRRQIDVEAEHQRALKDQGDEMTKTTKKLNNDWIKIMEKHKRTAEDALRSCEMDLNKVKEERNAYMSQARDLTTELVNYKQEIAKKIAASVGVGYKNMITDLQMEQARNQQSARKLNAMERPTGPHRGREYLRAIETSSTCESLSDANAENIQKQRVRSSSVQPLPKNMGITTKFQSSRRKL